MTTLFFGERWDAPRVEHATQIETPTGQACLYCSEPIEHDDRGLMVSYVIEIAGEPAGGTAPAHLECDLRTNVGSVQHLAGRCICQIGLSALPELPPAQTFREQALASLAWINAERARQGHDPL